MTSGTSEPAPAATGIGTPSDRRSTTDESSVSQDPLVDASSDHDVMETDDGNVRVGGDEDNGSSVSIPVVMGGGELSGPSHAPADHDDGSGDTAPPVAVVSDPYADHPSNQPHEDSARESSSSASGADTGVAKQAAEDGEGSSLVPDAPALAPATDDHVAELPPSEGDSTSAPLLVRRAPSYQDAVEGEIAPAEEEKADDTQDEHPKQVLGATEIVGSTADTDAAPAPSPSAQPAEQEQPVQPQVVATGGAPQSALPPPPTVAAPPHLPAVVVAEQQSVTAEQRAPRRFLNPMPAAQSQRLHAQHVSTEATTTMSPHSEHTVQSAAGGTSHASHDQVGVHVGHAGPGAPAPVIAETAAERELREAREMQTLMRRAKAQAAQLAAMNASADTAGTTG